MPHRRNTLILLAAALTIVTGSIFPSRVGAQDSGTHELLSADTAASWQTNGIVWALENANGIVYVTGTFTSVRPSGSAAGVDEVPRENFAAFDAATGALLPCILDLTKTGGGATGRALEVSPDGSRLYVGGSFGKAGTTLVGSFVSLDTATCSLTPGASFKRPRFNNTVRAISAMGGQVFVGGDFTDVSGSTRTRFAALDASGELAATSVSLDKPVRAVAAATDFGKVVIGGDFTSVNGIAQRGLVSIRPDDGAIVDAYPNWIPTNTAVKALARDDVAFYVGTEGTGSGAFDGRIAGDLASGAVIWRDECLGATQAVIPYQGHLYSASHAHECSQTEGGWKEDGFRQHLLAQSLEDKHIVHWFPDTNGGVGEGLGPRALTIAGGQLWVGGEFTSVNGQPQQGLTRFTAGPDVGAATPPTLSVSSSQAGLVRVAWKAAYDRDDATLIYTLFRDGTPVNTQAMGSRLWSRPQMSYTDSVPGGTMPRYAIQVSELDGSNISRLGPATSVTVSGTTSSYTGAVLADDPSLYYPLDTLVDGVNYTVKGIPYQKIDLPDWSKSNLIGTLREGVTLSLDTPLEGVPGGSVTLTGGRGYDGDNSNNLTKLTAPGQFSIEAWFRTTTTKGGKIIGFGERMTVDSSNPDRHVYMTDSGQLVFGVAPKGVRATIATPLSYNDGQWHQVVATSGSDGMKLYVDGALASSSAVTGAMDNVGFWRIGEDSLEGWPSASTSNAFAGSLDEISVYNHVLPGDRIFAHFALARPSVALDNQAPTAPTLQSPEVDGAAVTLDWDGATDNVGVAGYVVYRSTDRLFLPSATTELVRTTSPTYRDQSLSSKNYYYMVSALDGAGNQSDPSAKVKASVLQGDVVITATADTYVNASAVTSALGSTNSLGIYGTPEVITYLKFPIPAQAPNARISSAKLNIRTTGLNSSGSVDTQYVRVAGNEWSESSTDYNGRPPFTTNAIGTLPGGTAPNTSYGVPLDTAAIRATAGTDVTLAIIGSGADSLYLYSRESAATASRPSLSLSLETDTTNPEPPTALALERNGDSISLTWTAAADNQGVVSYQVFCGSEPDFSVGADNLAGEVPGTTYSEALTTETKYFKVVALDAAGNASGPSPVAVIDTTPPSSPKNVMASRDGEAWRVSWDASTDNISMLEYEVHVAALSGQPATEEGIIGTTSETSLPYSPAGNSAFVQVIARDTSDNRSAPSDEVEVDFSAPSAPGGPVAAVSGSTVNLSWSPASDNVGVTGYRLYRSSDAGFSPSGDTLVGSTSVTSYADEGLQPGVWHYRITAIDAAANVGDPGATGSASVVGPPTSVLATADAYVSANARTTNYGGTASLASYGSPLFVTYLRFVAPSAPPGQAVTSVILRLRTTNLSSAGSMDAQSVVLADNAWDESTVTFNSRPALSSEIVGSLPGGTTTNTTYDLSLNPASIDPRAGKEVTLAVTGTGTDSTWFNSRSASAGKPTLVVTFG